MADTDITPNEIPAEKPELAIDGEIMSEDSFG